PDIPEGDDLFDLPEECRLDNFADMDGRANFADVRLAWNEGGLAVQVRVRGKDRPPAGDATRPRQSDRLTLWLGTRGARTSHRASRYCHQFHLLAAGGGPERDQPCFAQTKINRALQDAPLAPPGAVPFSARVRAGSYRLAAFLPAAVLAGFDPEQNPRLGVGYLAPDSELGEPPPTGGTDFPPAGGPTPWSGLELGPA